MSTVGPSGSRTAGQELRGTSAPDRPTVPLICNRCGYPVSSRAMGCKNPCANCGTVYPLGDCSD